MQSELKEQAAEVDNSDDGLEESAWKKKGGGKTKKRQAVSYEVTKRKAKNRIAVVDLSENSVRQGEECVGVRSEPEEEQTDGELGDCLGCKVNEEHLKRAGISRKEYRKDVEKNKILFDGHAKNNNDSTSPWNKDCYFYSTYTHDQSSNCSPGGFIKRIKTTINLTIFIYGILLK